ncbi:hypothetical protein U3516DRAFT_755796 [Neocallimastix sp. 'constans']
MECKISKPKKKPFNKTPNCVKTLLGAAKLFPILWNEAIKYICTLYNLNPHQEINFKNSERRYSSYFSGYRVFDVISKLIIIVRDSYFNESILGSDRINLEDNIDLMDEYNNEKRIKIISNKSHAKIPHYNNKNNKNNDIININNNNGINFLDLNNYKNLSKSNFNNYEIENQKLIENEIESNHKNLKIMKIVKIKDYNSENEYEDNFILKGIIKLSKSFKSGINHDRSAQFDKGKDI